VGLADGQGIAPGFQGIFRLGLQMIPVVLTGLYEPDAEE
jgi:hypothetical protein